MKGLNVVHSAKVNLRNIKIQNILYNLYENKFVISDFSESIYVNANLNIQNQTYDEELQSVRNQVKYQTPHI